MFSHATTLLTQNSNGHALIHYHSILVLLFQLNKTRKRDNIAKVLIQTFHHNKLSNQTLFTLLLLNSQLLQNALKIIHVVMIKPFDNASRNLHTLLYAKVHSLVHHKNIATLRKCRNN